MSFEGEDDHAAIKRPVVRFAPSPNGFLHLGHGLSALMSFRFAQTIGARFLLRIEDIDIGRTRDEFVTAIFEDLAWLGITWEEPVRRQSQHFPDYVAAADRLDTMGLLYPCFATRAEINAAASKMSGERDPDGAPIYPGLWRDAPDDEVARRIEAREPFANRIDMAVALRWVEENVAGGGDLSFEEMADPFGDRASSRRVAVKPERWGDAVIQRKDVPTSYHLSVVVDDALQGVTHVTRGQDLFAATDLHRLLQVLLGLPEPAYLHHRLVLDAEGRKLSKSEAATSLRALRADGWQAGDVLARVGFER